jgi:hypothetical protein
MASKDSTYADGQPGIAFAHALVLTDSASPVHVIICEPSSLWRVTLEAPRGRALPKSCQDVSA